MIIGIDGNEANVENRVGVQEYAFQILWGLYNLHQTWESEHKLIVFLADKPIKTLPKETNFWKYRVLPGSGMWILKKLSPDLYFHRPRPDVFFTPSHYVPPLAPMPRVCSIMDLGYLKFSEQFRRKDFWQLKLWTAYSLLVSKKVLTISQSSKKNIVRQYRFASNKIVVTHLGYDKDRFNTHVDKKDVRRIREKYSIVNDYILFISTLKPSKNVEGLITAWRGVLKVKPAMKLVIAGKKGWLYDSIFEYVKKLDLENSIIFTGFVDEADKPALIKGARALVLPSFWEGFGLDPLYALACGTPAIVSNAGSLPEVVGEAGVLVDPYDPNTITQAILDVLDMNALKYSRMIKKGLNHAQKFSWEAAAIRTFETIKEAI